MSRVPIFKLVATVVLATGVSALQPALADAQTATLGLHGWQVQSTATAAQPGAQISNPRFAAGSWLQVRPDDGGAPGTEVNALVQNGRCPNVFFSTNMKHCFGYMSQIGPDTIRMFAAPWWFRTTFSSHLRRSEHAQLIVNGVVGEADVWVNGTQVAARATVQGDYTRYAFDVTRLVHAGSNTVALKLYPNDPTKMFTLDNVDWTQIPPDNNTGIQFPVQLHTSGPLAISDAHVVQHNARDFSSSVLTLKADVSNQASARQSGELSASVAGPGIGVISIRRRVSLAPGVTSTLSFTRRLVHPSVWWPYQMGSQPLYSLKMGVRAGHGGATDSQSETFGIRTVTTRLIGPAPIAPHGSRQFLVNGIPILFRGGGWSEDLFLHYSAADTADQIAMIKNLGLNGIRAEGKQMPADFYEQMDRAGILIDGGFQCCDAWQLPDDGKGVTAHDYAVLALSARTIGENMRDHPSVMNFSWSDNNPIPRQETVSLKAFREADFQQPLIASAEYKSTPRLGPSGEKEGPYDWVPPSYWYDATHFDPHDPTRTNVGGAWAFDSEAGAGHTVPTIDSIRRFMSPFEQTQLFKAPDFNQYHANYEPDLPNPKKNSGYSFGTLHDLDAAIRGRYGAWSNLQQYVQEAQLQNYETQRAQFEAYIAHSQNRKAPSTGIAYWQLNKGWPTLLWDLYNHDFDQAGSFFGAKKANEPLHVLYAYDNGSVAVDNLSGIAQADLSVNTNVYSTGGMLLDHRTAGPVTVRDQGVTGGLLAPKVPSATSPPTPARTYFVELVLKQHGQVIDRNVYWLSTQKDVVNWRKTMGLPQATMSQLADLTGLRGLPAARIAVSAGTHSATGPDRADTVTDVTITNTSSTPAVAFFLRADVRRGSATGTPAAGDNEVLPIFWSDNLITLWPGESETLHASYRRADLHGASPVVSVAGGNVPAVNVPAP